MDAISEERRVVPVRCQLAPGISLRSFRQVERCYYRRGTPTAMPLPPEEFALLLRCDGETELAPSPVLERLLRRKLAIIASGDTPPMETWQRWRFCDNRYVPHLYLQITERCNLNCRHCFNAAGNAAGHTEMPFDSVLRLLDEAADCGFHAVALTGGEPTLHPDFLRIAEAIAVRGMYLSQLLTNGSFLTEELLDALRADGSVPEIKISFDGVGRHDWLRRCPGAEKTALDAIRLCVSKGFPVIVQSCVHRGNADALDETLSLLDGLGVGRTRLIRTAEAPRMRQEAPEAFLDVGEYYELMRKTLRRYAAGAHRMVLEAWHYGRYDPADGKFRSGRCTGGAACRDDLPLCSEVRGQIAVGADGQVYPCLPLSGELRSRGVDLGNVFQTPLRELLESSRYAEWAEARLADRLRDPANEECRSCPHWERCRGGCPALGFYTSDGNRLAHDPWQCVLFRGGYDRPLE